MTVTTTFSSLESYDEEEFESEKLSDHIYDCYRNRSERRNGSVKSNTADSMRYMSNSRNNNASMKKSESYVELYKMI